MPALRPLPVDLEQLADVLDGGADGGEGRLDLTTGESWPEFTSDDAGLDVLDDDAEDEDRWLSVQSRGFRSAYREIVDFAATRTDEQLRRRLESLLLTCRWIHFRTCAGRRFRTDLRPTIACRIGAA
jgi:hypothetical protein